MPVEKFLKEMLPIAKEVEKEFGFDAFAILAQSLLETGAGDKVIRDQETGKTSNNYFNIKAGSTWKGETATLKKVLEYKNGEPVYEPSVFRAYATPKDSFFDYANMISRSKRYVKAYLVRATPYKYFEELARAGYATDPSYSQKLKKAYDYLLAVSGSLAKDAKL